MMILRGFMGIILALIFGAFFVACAPNHNSAAAKKLGVPAAQMGQNAQNERDFAGIETAKFEPQSAEISYEKNAGKWGSLDSASFHDVLKIKTKCGVCSKNGFETKINGKIYKSDVAITCCPSARPIDTSAGLKKVYIHRIADLRTDLKTIKIAGTNKVSESKMRLEPLFYAALKQELEARGIVVASEPESPYTLKVKFDFSDLKGVYNPASGELNARLLGQLNIKNINYSKNFKITTNQSVKGLKNSDKFDLYIGLIIKQAANKAAEQIAKF